MRAVRLGSYSIVATLPGTPALSRLKSMRRYVRRPSPPRWRTVILPWLLRPARLGRLSRRLLSGSVAVISSKLAVAMNRRPGLVGLYFLTGISETPEQALQLLTLLQGHDGLLPVGCASRHAAPAGAPHLAADVDGVDRDDLDALRLVDLLEGARDLRLRRVVGDAERVAALLEERVGTLGHQGPVDHFRGRSTHDARLSSSSPIASFAITSWSWVKMSYRLRLWARMTLAHGRLLVERAMTSLAAGSTTRTVSSAWMPRPRSSSAIAFVFGSSSANPSTIRTRPSVAFTLRAERSASRRILRGMRCEYVRPFGPHTVAPPTIEGSRVEPWRARPVPFWRYGLLPPPLTRVRFFVAAVAWRALASCRTYAWCITPMLGVCPKTASGRSVSPDRMAVASYVLTVSGDD